MWISKVNKFDMEVSKVTGMKRKIEFLLPLSLMVVLCLTIISASILSFTNPAYGAATQFNGIKPKYVFLFIGDGMSTPQVNSAQMYLGNKLKPGSPAIEKLEFTKFPGVGSADTYDASSFIPDSASTGTSIASGYKTLDGVINMDTTKKINYEPITRKLKRDGYKIGIISTVTLNHATPAVFYANEASRNNYYSIAKQMATSGFDFFGGGYFGDPDGKKAGIEKGEHIFDLAKKNGYKVVTTKKEILNLNNRTGKVLAVDPTALNAKDGDMAYEIDRRPDELSLADFVRKGIEVLDNPNGYFMMVESGKIDWACHANDAGTSIMETIAFNEAIKEALKVYDKYPNDTLIIVTGDHETGGMTIGFAGTNYNTFFGNLDRQHISYANFDKIVNDYKSKTKPGSEKLEDLLPQIKQAYGLVLPTDPDAANHLVLTEVEITRLRNALRQTMVADSNVGQEYLLYGYQSKPLTVTCNHILNNRAGVHFSTYAHSGLAVPVYAIGQGYELFFGAYDNTDINEKMKAVTKVK